MSSVFPNPQGPTWDSERKIWSGAKLFWEPVKPVALMTKGENERRLSAIAVHLRPTARRGADGVGAR